MACVITLAVADTGWFSASGEGSRDISGSSSLLVQTIWCSLDSLTSGRIRVSGTVFPKTVRYAGVVGLLTDDRLTDDTTTVYVPWYWQSIPFEQCEFDPPQYVGAISRKVFWRLPAGVGIHLKVFW